MALIALRGCRRPLCRHCFVAGLTLRMEGILCGRLAAFCRTSMAGGTGLGALSILVVAFRAVDLHLFHMGGMGERNGCHLCPFKLDCHRFLRIVRSLDGGRNKKEQRETRQ